MSPRTAESGDVGVCHGAWPDGRTVERITAPFGPTDPGAPPRFLTKDDCLALLTRAASFAAGGGVTSLQIADEWAGELRWSRNRTQVVTDRRDCRLGVLRAYLQNAFVELNQTDDAALAAAVRRAESLVPFGVARAAPDPLPPGPPVYPETHIWSDVTYNQPPTDRVAIARMLLAPAESAGLLSAGYLRVAARGSALFDTRDHGRTLYAPQTFAECSITVRDPQTGGGGWAGASSYDWTAFDAEALAKRALDKCVASRNPVRLEPGRYEVVLEPQAAHDLVRTLLGPIDRWPSELPPSASPYYLGPKSFAPFGKRQTVFSSKIGMRLIDERITISHDPTDPQLGVLPFSMEPTTLDPTVINPGAFAPWDPHRAVTWFDKGVLTNLAYNRRYAIEWLRAPRGLPYSGAFRMSGGDTPIEQMIASTKRGLLVTRFSGMQLLNQRSLLYTGLTRDGLWLIEDGKISKPVKNFRFTESPLFVLNNVVDLGPPVPVFSPGQPAVVPPLHLRDFAFSSLTDAV